MRTVNTINLNGRAYQLEEQGYEALQKYLHKAELALAENPDKAEVITDLEQAIADKCDRLLKNGRNVVTAEQISTIVTEMGVVEDDEVESDKAAAADTKTVSSKRLFTIREGSVILGVCKGIGVYLGVDANIVRILFVALTLATHGFGILLYIALGIFLPTAKTDGELAEAYGEPVKAQDIVDRAKERARDPETIQRASNVVVKIFRILMGTASAAAGILLGIVTFAWAWTLWQLVVGRLELHGSLYFLNGWRETLAITLAYLVVALPLFLIFRGLGQFARQLPQSRWITAIDVTLVAVWTVAIMGVITFGSTYAGAVRSYVRENHGYLNVGNSSVCVDHSVCDTSHPGTRLGCKNDACYKY